MQMDMLPVGEIAFNVEINLNEILNTPNDVSVGYFFEVDLNYPGHLHDDYRDFSLPLPKKMFKMIGLANINFKRKRTTQITLLED